MIEKKLWTKNKLRNGIEKEIKENRKLGLNIKINLKNRTIEHIKEKEDEENDYNN